MLRGARAYLAGIGTAGALVLGAALVFVLAGAVVAFRGWPAPHGGRAPARQVVTVAAAPGPVARRLAVISDVALARPVTRRHSTAGSDAIRGRGAHHSTTSAVVPVPVDQAGAGSQAGSITGGGSPQPVRNAPPPTTTTTITAPTATTPTATVATVTTTTPALPAPTTPTTSTTTTAPAPPPVTTTTVPTTPPPGPGSSTITDPVAPVVSGVGDVVTTVGTTVSGVGNTLGSTVGSVGSGTPLAPVTGTLGGVAGGTLGGLGTTLSGVGGLLSGS